MDFGKYYNKFNNCDNCINKYSWGDDEIGCRRQDKNLDCRFQRIYITLKKVKEEGQNCLIS